MTGDLLKIWRSHSKTLGHLSARDPEGCGLWMKSNAIGLGEVGRPEDFDLLSFDGGHLDRTSRPHSKWPIPVTETAPPVTRALK